MPNVGKYPVRAAAHVDNRIGRAPRAVIAGESGKAAVRFRSGPPPARKWPRRRRRGAAPRWRVRSRVSRPPAAHKGTNHESRSSSAAWPAARRARRACAGWTRTAEILMVERGPYVSYANCGLPYHVGGVIEKESSLLVADANTFRSQFAIDVRTGCEAIKISPDKKTVELRNVATGEVTTESYDKLVLSPGAPSIRPPLPGHRPAGHLPGAGPCPTRGRSASGSNEARCSSPGCTGTRASRRCGRRRARWWSAAASSASRRRRTSSTAAST